MSRKALGPRRQYSDEFKREALRLAESVGGTEAARRLGVPDSSIDNWIKLSRAGKVPGVQAEAAAVKHPQSALEAENARLRRELANAKLDLEIVKKAAAYFARESR
jgi:transposase